MSGIWPGDTRCVAMITFDMDGPSATLNRNPDLEVQPSVISMGEFGPNVAVPRILDLLDDLGVKTTFFVPGWVAERHEDTVRDVVAHGHEVAHHGYRHEPPATLSGDGEEGEVLDHGAEILEGITGQRVVGYRSPSWELSANSLDLLKERGFVYDSSLMGNDIPYFVEAEGGRMVELPVHWSLDDAPYYTYSPVAGRTGPMATAPDVLEAWKWEFDGAHRLNRSFMLTMHPHTSGRLARLMALEKLINYIRTYPGVEFMRCIDVAERWTDAGMSG
ncbi:MAG: polysaccharide deacetylase [Dehalococcoidia bacterium]|nr:ribulose phosphate epimerase [Chloroflexota bacterium]MDP5877254.1 polysaccharide deacetylase [Dehalococcoidia bacterium]MDP6274058.1 polysaccharide deacetylase [Dehalococcoidia bacterium]MDP7212469.1 polysaccharide deacetylase [Dehalococcoidia bacterium]MDP7513736.1 polysaccharide deacetylase [Dehalococcoidia bacterium]